MIRKLLYITLSLLLCISHTYATTSELVGFFSLEDNAANSTVTDAHTGGYDLAVINDQTNYSSEQSASAKVSLGFDLDGTTDYVEGTAGTGPTTTCSIQAWVQPDINNQEMIIVYLGDGVVTGGGADHFRLGMNSSGQAFIEAQRGSLGARAVGTTTLLTDGTWYHLVGVCRGITDREIYVNNVSEGTNTTSESPAGVQDEWAIGANHTDADVNFDGIVDEVGIWSDGLTTGEISALYNSGSGLAYPFSAGATAAQIW